mmetsp:Transcript_8754/g.23635  ORF Transcript_8754/g.23635 Transcript_8754/m.23635 type:complete len:234 (+) Transcript_8754:3595-4296(+)
MVAVHVSVTAISTLHLSNWSEVRTIYRVVVGAMGAHCNSTYDTHLVSGKGSSLITANHTSAAKSLNRGKFANNRVLLSHTAGAKSKGGRHNSWKAFRNSCDSQSNSNFQIIGSALKNVSFAVRLEVVDVHKPYKNTDDSDDLREELTKLIKLDFKRCLYFLLFLHLLCDGTDSSVASSSRHDSSHFTAAHSCATEKKVLLVLINSAYVQNRGLILRNRFTLSSQDGLINQNRG